MSTEAMPPSHAKPRGRWRRRLLLTVLGVVALVALAPFYLGALVRPFVVGRIEEDLDVQARVQSIAFGWPLRLEMRGLEILDEEQRLLASLDDLVARVELGALLAGRIHAEVVLTYPELHLSRAPDGRWNWDRTLAKVAQRASDEHESPETSEELPDVQVHLRLTDGHLVFHGAGGETTLSDLALEVRVDGLDRPAPFQLAFQARGPHAPAGGLRLEGSFTAAPHGRVDPVDCAGEARLALEALDLAGFAPALSLVAPLQDLGGSLNGGLELTLAPGLALSGTGDVELLDLSLRGPLSGPDPARLERVEIHLDAEQRGEGEGTQRLELRAGALLDLVYEGHSNLAAQGTGEVAGTLTLGADLGRLTELARGWVPIQAGIEVQGRLEHTLELQAGLLDREPRTARLHARGGVHGLSARDAGGRALDLSQLEGIALELQAAVDLEHGLLTLPKLSLEAGPVSVHGHLEASGVDLLGSVPELRTGELHLAADLERLRGTLSQLVALDPASLGGRVRADVTLDGAAAGLGLAVKIEADALAFAGSSLATLQGELGAQRAADGGLSGSGELRSGSFGWARGEGPVLALPAAEIRFELAEDALGKGRHALTLETVDAALALELRVDSVRQGSTTLLLQNELECRGDVARLATLAAPFVPVQPGLAGALTARADFALALEESRLGSADGRFELDLTELAVRDANGVDLGLEALARIALVLEAELDARSGRAELRSLSVDSGGLTVHGSGRALGLGGADPPEIEGARLTLEADLARLGPELGRVLDLQGLELGGSPLTLEARLSTKDGRVETKGSLASSNLRLARPAAPPIELAELGIDFDLGYDVELGSLHVRHAGLRSRTATLGLAGTLNEITSSARARGAMQLEVAGELERILGDLGLETAESGRHTSGSLSGKFKLEGDRGDFRVTGKSTIEGFRIEIASQAEHRTAEGAEGDAPLVVEDPAITLDVEARVALPALDVELAKLTIDSRLARGGAQGRIENLRGLGTDEVRFVGLTGQLAYVPDRLGLVLAPYLPGKLSGAEEERATFTLDGSARDFDLTTLLEGSRARMDLGFGRLERPEIQLGGALVLEAKEQKLQLRGDLSANDGTLQVDGTLDPGLGAGSARSRLTLTAKELRANSGLAPLLALLHPAFAATSLTQGSLEGRIALDLDLSYDGPLTLEMLEAGWESLAKEPIQGAGRLELRSAALRGSPLLAMLGEFGVEAGKALDLRPIEFTIQKGRLSYAKPWSWTISGTETTFSGSVGLDQSLDLTWNLPITDALVGRFDFLSALKGETLAIPLRGSVRAPRLEADGLLKDLAAKAAKRELESRLGLGGGKSTDDPASLLSRADELWGQGKKSAAAALYTRLKDEFKLSLTYALNKDRIKDRSKYKAPQ